MKHRRGIPSDPNTNDAGSPTSGEPVYLTVGKLRRSHGIKGEMLADVLTDFPERIRVGRKVFVGDQHMPMRIAGLRPHGNGLLIKFDEIENPEDAARYRNLYIFVQAKDLPKLPEGEYYYHQLLGLKVITPEGETLGTIEEILETGANDVYLVRGEDGKEVLLPAIDEVVLGVDLEKGELTARPPEWS